MSRFESMAEHPAGKGIPRTPDRIQSLIDAAQDEQALELANRGHADLEVWAGGPMRRINERHHEVSGRLAWLDAATIVGLLLLVVFGPLLLSGWWPA